MTLINNLASIDRGRCTACGTCAKICLYDAITLRGETMSAADVIDHVLRDEVFFMESGGGVTFSGGEPLFQEAFLISCLEEAKKNHLHTAVDTSGFASKRTIEAVIPLVDLFLYDLKGIDPIGHRRMTGVDNKIILENLLYLSDRNIPLWIRIPIVRGYNDSEDDLLDLTRFLRTVQFEQINLLEYHTVGSEKYSRLGIENQLETGGRPENETIALFRQTFEDQGWKVILGG